MIDGSLPAMEASRQRTAKAREQKSLPTQLCILLSGLDFRRPSPKTAKQLSGLA
jgi:hypothetical protein